MLPLKTPRNREKLIIYSKSFSVFPIFPFPSFTLVPIFLFYFLSLAVVIKLNKYPDLINKTETKDESKSTSTEEVN